MNKNDELRKRLLDFAVSVMELGDPAPKAAEAREVIAQIIRSGTTAAIVYCRAELELTRPNHSDELWGVLGSLKEAESLLEKLVPWTNARNDTNESFEKSIEELRQLMGIKIRREMEKLCG